jgi:hypothetical protein
MTTNRGVVGGSYSETEERVDSYTLDDVGL